jgi:hypothetical protein
VAMRSRRMSLARYTSPEAILDIIPIAAKTHLMYGSRIVFRRCGRVFHRS